MPRRARAASCVVNTISSGLTHQYKGLWVSDALLNETLHRFCHRPKRYGSNVPGPLESRRRSSKRKNTSLAYGPGGTPNIYDPLVMLGKSSRDQWWKQHQDKQVLPGALHATDSVQTPVAETSSILPAWLLKSLVGQKTTETHTAEIDATLPIQLVEDADYDTLELDLKTRLARATDFDSITTALQGFEQVLRQHPELSKHLFLRLMQLDTQNQQYEHVARALYDPSWNPPGSGNVMLVLRESYSRQMPYQSWKFKMLPAISKSIRLGLVSIQDIQEIILLVPGVHDNLLGYKCESATHVAWHQLITAIKQSSILHLADLDVSFLKTWYQQIENASSLDDNVLQLLWHLREPLKINELSLASELIVKRMKALAQSEEALSEKLPEWFETIAKEMQGAVLLRATFRMIELAQEDDSNGTKILELWSSTLPQLYAADGGEFPINTISWAQTRRLPCTLSPPQQVLAVIWVATTLWNFNHDDTTSPPQIRIQEDFKAMFATMESTNDLDTVSQVVMSLDTLPLPDKDRVFQYFQYFSDQELVKLLGYDIYRDGLKDCFRNNYMILQDDLFTGRIRQKFPHVLPRLCESINTDIYKFKIMAQILIFRNQANLRVVWRLLTINPKLALALSQSQPKIIEKLQNHKTSKSEIALNPALVLKVVEQLIMTFAVTPTTSPRCAFKYIKRMYTFLRQVGAPINTVVARALWHSGVTRFGHRHASHAQVSWCLTQVRKIEGDEVADRLLWSAGYRKTFLWEFAQLLKKDRQLLDTELAKSEGCKLDRQVDWTPPTLATLARDSTVS